MSESTRPSFQSVQRTLLVGVLAGLIFGCILGTVVGAYYAWQVDPAVYVDGAFPPDLAPGYQSHYLAMVVDSYVVNQEADVASERLKAFDQETQVRTLAERSAAYVAAGRGVEAQLINDLAAALKTAESWNEDTIKSVVSDLSTKYQSDPARAQAISTFSQQVLDGQIPVPADATPAEEAAPVEPPPAAGPVTTEPGGMATWLRFVLCCLVLLIVAVVAVLLAGRWQRSRKPAKPQVVWEGEGAPPLKQWTGTYTLGQDNYDEFFTIETDDGDFLGESGIGIMDVVPGSQPKQVLTFDVGLFDKTDITTLSRVIMSEYAYNDEKLRAKVDANPQAQAILAQPGTTFEFETSAMRVEAEILDMEYGEGGNQYFSKLTTNLKVFLKEGADLKVGEMDVPEEYQN